MACVPGRHLSSEAARTRVLRDCAWLSPTPHQGGTAGHGQCHGMAWYVSWYMAYSKLRKHAALGPYSMSMPRSIGTAQGLCVSLISSNPCMAWCLSQAVTCRRGCAWLSPTPHQGGKAGHGQCHGVAWYVSWHGMACVLQELLEIRTHTALESYGRSRPRGIGPPWGRCVSLFTSNPCMYSPTGGGRRSLSSEWERIQGYLTYKKTHPPRTLP